MSADMSALRLLFNPYLQKYDSDGNLGVPFDGGNWTEFTITPDAEEVEVISTRIEDGGQAADAMTDPKPSKASFVANRFTRHTLAMNLMGDVTARTAAEATITDKTITVEVGELFTLGAYETSAETFTSMDGLTTYVKDTDYEEVDTALGLYKVIDGGGISDGTILADFTKAAESGHQINGGVDSTTHVKIFGRAKCMFTSKIYYVEIEKGSIRPSQSISLVGTDPASAGYEVTIITPDDGSAGFKFIEV